jgi:hypothetical protein
MGYPNNANDYIYELRYYIHVGSSCGIKGGCNNISPVQQELMFYVDNLPASLEVKLWKKRPKDAVFDKADYTYEIRFEETFE